jgi:hypothetical protein
MCPKCAAEILAAAGKENQINCVLSEGEENYLSGLTNLATEGKIMVAGAGV